MRGGATSEAAVRATDASIYWCSAPALLLASQLSTMRLPPAEELRHRLVSVLDRFESTARGAGISGADIAEARYAMVAFMDEQILKSDWVNRSEWMNQPLQLLLYREYTAGENFYARMRSLLQSGERLLALEAYYLCLSLGFRGAANARGEGRSSVEFLDTGRERLAAVFTPSPQLSPNAWPQDRASAQKQSRWPLIAWVAGCAIAALGLWGGLKWSIERSVASTVQLVPGAPDATPH
ncbi:MAG TPA: type IVB secretion system protein IcmH/DotU [Polyangiaceae bacterium]|nr:type IVB secretion system protein IcmH/DotU [Polyangiaceae bacterium]